MEANKREIRTINGSLAIREKAEGEDKECRTLEGRAIVFNSESEVLDEWGYRFREVIKPEACSAEFVNSQDIKLNMLHDRNSTIGRRTKDGKGNMRLEVREDGVYFSIEVPKCDLGDRALEMVRSGVYTGCSFEFYPEEYEIEERENEDGSRDAKITHTKFRALTALTIGMDPAYAATNVNARELIHHEEPKPNPNEDTDADRMAAEREAMRIAIEIREREMMMTH